MSLSGPKKMGWWLVVWIKWKSSYLSFKFTKSYWTNGLNVACLAIFECGWWLGPHYRRTYRYRDVPEILIGSFSNLYKCYPPECNGPTQNLVQLDDPSHLKWEPKRRHWQVASSCSLTCFCYHVLCWFQHTWSAWSRILPSTTSTTSTARSWWRTWRMGTLWYDPAVRWVRLRGAGGRCDMTQH